MSSVNAAMQNQIASVQQALSISGMRKAMGQSADQVSKLVEGMQETSQAVQQARAAGPGRGQNINLMA
jgi:methyl-accepting chemotaxis protein